MLDRLRRTARDTARDLGVRSGLRPYRPMQWNAGRWAPDHADPLTARYGALDEVGRYGLLLGYVTWLGGRPSVLDVGCGAGLLRDRLGVWPFSSYVGVDPAPEAIEAAQAAYGDDRTRFVAGDPMTLDLGRFDVVICSEVLYFDPHPPALVDRVGDFLAPDGHLLSSIWRHPGDVTLWRALDTRYRLVDRTSARNRGNPRARRGWVASYHRPR